MKNKIAILLLGFGFLTSCDYLDIVPDNVATIDYAFRQRTQAQKFLYTCYSYMPDYANFESMPGLVTGDEVWFYHHDPQRFNTRAWEIARGNQNVVNPHLNYWDGSDGGKPLFQAIRDCNTFLKNIDKTPDIEGFERKRWTAEVEFLKAYYHWFLFRMYGPIPIIDKNLPISTGPTNVKVFREPVDSCVNYIVNLIDTAMVNLPEQLDAEISEKGRVTKPIAMALKARILITAASPLFNGNSDYSSFVDKRDKYLFNPTYEVSKWQRAAAACKAAIEECHSLGYHLNHFQPTIDRYNLDDNMQVQMDIRSTITDKWNSEIIWGATNSMASKIQQFAQPPLAFLTFNSGGNPYGMYGPPLKIANQFYTKNGLPIDKDKYWDYGNRMELDTATQSDFDYIQPGYITVSMNFNREPRYYADIGFDGGIWYGQGEYDINSAKHVENRAGGYSGRIQADKYSITGMFAKKLVNFLNITENDGKYDVQSYPWPILRLSQLYLYYAEALNEIDGPTAEAFKWIDLVRDRAGIPSVEDSWINYSNDPGMLTSKAGFRQIVHREELIEMAFEGQRYWDILRWKKGEKYFNEPITGWNISSEDAPTYYQPVFLYNQIFRKKDYLWPIKENDLIVNDNLIQNPGWPK